MKFSSKILSQTITQLCKAKAIEHIVISPGSRNAPLTIGFTNDNFFTTYSIVDERCAAFFALGIAQQSKKPVALVCTSGSALLNYYPAVAESFYSDIPLVVLSSDRPENLVEIGDGQTIMQENVYANHILYSANCKEGSEHQIKNETEINIALNSAIELQGPVHINIPFSEPLYNVVDDLQVQPQHVPTRNRSFLSSEIGQAELTAFFDTWNKAKRKMVLVGVLSPHSITQQLLKQLADDPSVIVLTETTSNLHQDGFFPSIDQLIAPLTDDGFLNLQPDVLLTFGGMIISKKVKAFLRTFSPNSHWHVDTKKAYDTFFRLKHHFKTTPQIFLEHVTKFSEVLQSDYQSYWSKIQAHRDAGHVRYMEEMPFSDFKVFHHIVSLFPKTEVQLQLSNSTTIRYAQLFKIPQNVSVFCNRGTSGIDGSTSTAIGASVAAKNPVLFITGDLSFFYDSNALWNSYIPAHFRIIIINNSGGGIFRILPKAKSMADFETYFETKHTLTAVHLCKMYQMEYISANNSETTITALQTFYDVSERPKVLEIFTPATINDQTLLSYFDALS